MSLVPEHGFSAPQQRDETPSRIGTMVLVFARAKERLMEPNQRIVMKYHIVRYNKLHLSDSFNLEFSAFRPSASSRGLFYQLTSI